VESHWLGMSLLSARWPSRMLTGQLLVREWWQSWQLNEKLIKYSNLPTNLIFQPIAVENLRAFISALGYKISSVSGKERETSFLFR